MALITAKDLAVGYESAAVASGISFTVSRGDYLCIVGENGAGKSTLMKTLLRLQDPLAGELVYGEDLKEGGIGYLPQQTVVQKDFPASVMEIVLSGLQRKKGSSPFYNREDKSLALEKLTEMGIEELRNRCYRELSGGQQQRVLLARALCAAGSMIVMDEPTAGLDPAATEEMYKIIEDLNTGGMTVIMISHDIGAAFKYASHILMISDAPYYGTRDDYLSSPEGLSFAGKGGGSRV